MRIAWEDEKSSGFALRAVPGEYDGFPPVDALRIDRAPRGVDLERVALASYLAFGTWTSGDLSLPDGLSPGVAEMIERDAVPVRVRPSPVLYAPRPMPQGERVVEVVFALPAALPSEPTLAVVPSTIAEGVFRSGSLTIVPCNAFALDAAHGSKPGILARLATAVLFAEEVAAKLIRITGVTLGTRERARLQVLCRSVNLGLEFS